MRRTNETVRKETGSEDQRVEFVQFSVYGAHASGLDALEWARRGERLGAGELVVNSIDADGTKDGYDIELTAAVSESIDIPVIASGGAGTLEHMVDVLDRGKADAVLAASIFHFGEFTIHETKEIMAGRGVPVRL